MSMEEMLCLAQRAAAGDSTAAAAHFKRLLERYRHHPAVQKRGREVTSVARACGSVAARGGSRSRSDSRSDSDGVARGGGGSIGSRNSADRSSGWDGGSGRHGGSGGCCGSRGGSGGSCSSSRSDGAAGGGEAESSSSDECTPHRLAAARPLVTPKLDMSRLARHKREPPPLRPGRDTCQRRIRRLRSHEIEEAEASASRAKAALAAALEPAAESPKAARSSGGRGVTAGSGRASTPPPPRDARWTPTASPRDEAAARGPTLHARTSRARL